MCCTGARLKSVRKAVRRSEFGCAGREVTPRGRGGVVFARRVRGGSGHPSCRFGRPPTPAAGAAVAPLPPERVARPIAARTSRRPDRPPTGGDANEADPLEMQCGTFRPAAPDLEVVPGRERSRDAREQLRRFERDAGERVALGSLELEGDMPTLQNAGDGADRPRDDRAHERSDVADRATREMVARSLVGAKEEPALDRLGAHAATGPQGSLRARPPKTVEDRTRRVRCDEETSGPGVVAEKQRRFAPRDLPHAGGADVPRAPPTLGRAVGDQLPRTATPRPGDRGARADEAPIAALGANDRARGAKRGPGLGDGNDLPHRAPVEFGRQSPVHRDERGVRSPLSGAGGPKQSLPTRLQPRPDPVPRDGAAAGVRPDRASPQRSPTAPRSRAEAESRGQRRVAPGLPRDVRVQSDETGLAEEIEVERPGLLDELGERPGGAAPAGAIRVVDADPDRRTPSRVRRSG